MTLRFANKMKMVLSAALIAAATVPAHVQAQDVSETHLSAARAAISALRATDPFDAILLGAAEGLKTRLISSNPDLENEISTIVDEQTLALVPRRADLENEAARIYAAAFTEEELSAIAAFYDTEPGKKLLQNGPIVAREISGAASIWARGIERDLLESVIAAMNEAGLRANTEGAAPQGAAPEGGATDGATGQSGGN